MLFLYHFRIPCDRVSYVANGRILDTRHLTRDAYRWVYRALPCCSVDPAPPNCVLQTMGMIENMDLSGNSEKTYLAGSTTVKRFRVCTQILMVHACAPLVYRLSECCARCRVVICIDDPYRICHLMRVKDAILSLSTLSLDFFLF